ncbi:MAG: hypothetical protein B9S32_12105 [Verrucomicrobia bacterium Tous-C9LFEB]|nr:MAG: hypothetical protein B9S32_12105 [Verrucomicrobia bacterium Tous-C9LFEB]
MSDHSHTFTPPSPERLTHDLDLVSKISLVVGVIALILSAVGGYCDRVQALHSYLFAFLYFYTIMAGAFFWTILHHAVDANWSVIVRRQFENIANLMGVMAIGFIPLFIFREDIWKWTQPSELAHSVLLQEKHGYLNMPFFIVRLIFYFGFFTGAAYFYRKLSTAQDSDGSIVHSWRLRWWSPLSIIGFGLAITFSALDWLMALDYHWYSTMWGVYIFAGSAQSSMATCILIVFLLRKAGYLKPLSGEHAHIMGKLLFAFTVFWAYIAFSQYMLIWYANIPEETVFFIKRNNGSWTYLSVFLVAGHFIFPFLYLLTQAVKKSWASLSVIAVWILFMHGVDHFWIIAPVVRPDGFSMRWTDFTSFIGLAGILVYVFIRILGSAGLFPARDPRLNDCIKLTN